MIEELTSRADWTTTLRVSKSQIQTYLICPKKFHYQYVIGQDWEFVPHALPFGRAIHAAGAFFYLAIQARGVKPTLDELLEEWRTAWAIESADPRIRFDDKNSLEGLGELGERMLTVFHRETEPRQVAAVEYPFAVPLHDPDTGEALDIQLVGLIDLIEADEDGNLIVAELKTAAKKMGDGEADSKLDGLIYAYAMERLGHRTTDQATLVRIDVLTKTKEPSLQQAFTTKEDGDYRKLQRWIRDILGAIEAGSFYPVFGWACKQCPFARACIGGMRA